MNRTRDELSKSNLTPHGVLSLSRNNVPPLLPLSVQLGTRDPHEANSTTAECKLTRTAEMKVDSWLETSVLPQTCLTSVRADRHAGLLVGPQNAGQVATERE